MTTDRFYHLICECKYEFMYDSAGIDYPECPACGCYLHDMKEEVKPEPSGFWVALKKKCSLFS